MTNPREPVRPLFDDEDVQARIVRARPAADASPEPAQTLRKSAGGRSRSETSKVPVSIRLDREVVEKFRATGPGWQTRINAVLRSAKP